MDSSVVQVGGCIAEYCVVEGFPTELVWAEPSFGSINTTKNSLHHKNASGPLVVMIPGFPGIARLYTDFLTSLVVHTGCPAVCITWCGMHCVPTSLRAHMPKTSLQLEGQASFYLAVIKKLRALPWVSKLVLVGQSLGCWFLARALEAVDTELLGPPVVAVHLFCPVMQNLNSNPRKKRLQRPVGLAYALHLDIFVWWVLVVLPTSVSVTLIHLIYWLRGKTTLAREERDFWSIVVAHLQTGVLRSAMALGLEAFETLHAPGTWLKSLRDRKDSVAFHFGLTDGWTPASVREHLGSSNCLPDARQYLHNMPHGIITDRAAARALAVHVGPDIAASLC